MKHTTSRTSGVVAVTAALLVGAAGSLLGQGAVITGKVTGGQNEALGGALVISDALNSAVATTTTGTYTLAVPPERTKRHTVTLHAGCMEHAARPHQTAPTPR